MEAIELKAKLRAKAGKGEPKRLRKQNLVPGVVYANTVEPYSVVVQRGDLEHAFHTSAGENVVINLVVEDEATKNATVVIKEVQHDILTDRITHVDFKVVSLTDTITVKVPLHPVGESAGVVAGGILDVVHREIEIECLPTNIPARIDVDVTALTIGHNLHAKELVLPSGVTCVEDPEAVIVVVSAPRVASEEAAEGEGEGASEPEVITRKKEEPSDK